ncbi:MAG: ATP-dependent protease ATPase subunit HslU [Clostridia bacterium]|nr:ATP-dependent protease ATPase subunit HslU [Clostridia bacterium]
MLTPKQIVDQLNRYIVGQDDAKKHVAIALRNRYRRSRLSPELREEITPKNIIMMGPTGVGKTEIARRLAKLVEAPFVKVEATKFTEVGYVGRDVDSMVRDLVEASVRLCKQNEYDRVRMMAEAAAEQRLVDLITADPTAKQSKAVNIFGLLIPHNPDDHAEPQLTEEEKLSKKQKREMTLESLRKGELEDRIVTVEVTESGKGSDAMVAMGIDLDLNEMFGGMMPKKKKQRKVPVSEARRILIAEESDKLIDMDEVIDRAIQRAEQDGIIFIDEIDKIAAAGNVSGVDVSREGVQRDILPIVEGSTVTTKYGPVKTDYMLFIAAGAFHVSKVSDLIPELQGRFPIRVKLDALTVEDYERILTQPENAVTKQYEALLMADNVRLSFDEGAKRAIAEAAFRANETSENIGARRLHTIIENLLEDISYNATGEHPLIDVVINKDYVESHLKLASSSEDLNKYIV